jgi:hypothetical protein
MRLSKSLLFAGGAIAAVVLATGICIFHKTRANSQANACINNLRPYPPEQYEKWRKEEAAVGAVVTNGSAFSNVVAILGTNFITFTNCYRLYFANFKYKLPSRTNSSSIAFRVDERINEQGTESKVQYLMSDGSPFPNTSQVYDYEEEKEKNLWVSANVPKGTSFSNAVAILGTNYTTINFNDIFFYANFKCKLPSLTNLPSITFRVESNKVEWNPMMPPSLTR